MFDIGWSELLVIAVVAIVVIVPKDLPKALRTFGRWAGKMKRMAREFQSQFSEALREAELEDVKTIHKEVTSIRDDLRKAGSSINADLARTDAEMTKLKADPKPAEPTPVIAAEPEPAAAEPKP